MNPPCTPYPRKKLYLLLTIPILVMYIAIALLLWQVNHVAFVSYLSLFVLVAISQSYVCVCWQCPYVGKFAPCVGGFCLPSSQLARLFKHVKRTKRAYNIVVTLAFGCFLGIIGLPIYFLFQQGIGYGIAYLGVVLVYAACFLWWICPVCGTRHVCPGGQTATKLKEMFAKE